MRIDTYLYLSLAALEVIDLGLQLFLPLHQLSRRLIEFHLRLVGGFKLFDRQLLLRFDFLHHHEPNYSMVVRFTYSLCLLKTCNRVGFLRTRFELGGVPLVLEPPVLLVELSLTRLR